MVTIEFLKDFHSYSNEVSDILMKQWGYLVPDKDISYWINAVKNRMNKNAVPTIVIALENDKLLGTASLFTSDMDGYKNYSPWLSAVLLKEEFRNKGIGSKLVNKIIEISKKLKINPFYLYTEDKKNFYTQLGWELLESTNYKDNKVSVMSYKIK